MNVEDNIKLIVEQVLSEIAKGKKDPCSEQGELNDLTAVDLQKFLQVPEPINRVMYKEIKAATPARIGVWRAGTRPLTETLLRFRADHATAQDAVLNDVSEGFIQKNNWVQLQSSCRDKDEYLTRPDLGRKLSEESIRTLKSACKQGTDLQIIISDGLSSKAIESNIPDLLPAFLQGLNGLGIHIGTTVFVKYGRVAVMDVIGEELKPKAAIILLGERPGLGTAESLSAYLAFNPRIGMIESERTVVSNIHKNGIPATEAGAHLASVIKAVLEKKASGVNLDI